MKLGIFGGTFDPPHIGHINAFKGFMNQFEFDSVCVIPVCMPPHKALKTTTSTDDRMAMVKLAFEKISPKVSVSDLEIKRKGKSYTADTIRYFVEKGYDDIYFLCGTDMFLTLDMWYHPEYIFSNATIVYARREAEENITQKIKLKTDEYISKFNAKIIPLNTRLVEISSTEIRTELTNGNCPYLTFDVMNYIIENKLYGIG